jgi:hypothetical protein
MSLLSGITERAGDFPNRLAIERKQGAIPSLVPSYGCGFTQASINAQRQAQKRAAGFKGRRSMEVALMENPEMARLSTRLLAERFGVCALTARRARLALENRGMIPRRRWGR